MAGLYWTARDGQLGTAHKNRKKEEVDFRPSRWVRVFNNRIQAEPPKGQEHAIKPLCLEPERKETRVVRKDYPCPGMQSEIETIYASYAGVEIAVEGEECRKWYDLTAKAASEAADEKWREEYHARRDKGKEFIKIFPMERIVREATHSEADRLRNGKIVGAEVVRRIVIDAGKELIDGFDRDFWQETVAFANEKGEEAKASIIAAEEQRRAEKKAAWMARKDKE